MSPGTLCIIPSSSSPPTRTMPRHPAKNSKAIQETLEFSLLHGGPFSQHLLDSVLYLQKNLIAGK